MVLKHTHRKHKLFIRLSNVLGSGSFCEFCQFGTEETASWFTMLEMRFDGLHYAKQQVAASRLSKSL
jgi:hypothetical protein